MLIVFWKKIMYYIVSMEMKLHQGKFPSSQWPWTFHPTMLGTCYRFRSGTTDPSQWWHSSGSHSRWTRCTILLAPRLLLPGSRTSQQYKGHPSKLRENERWRSSTHSTTQHMKRNRLFSTAWWNLDNSSWWSLILSLIGFVRIWDISKHPWESRYALRKSYSKDTIGTLNPIVGYEFLPEISITI